MEYTVEGPTLIFLCTSNDAATLFLDVLEATAEYEKEALPDFAITSILSNTKATTATNSVKEVISAHKAHATSITIHLETAQGAAGCAHDRTFVVTLLAPRAEKLRDALTLCVKTLKEASAKIMSLRRLDKTTNAAALPKSTGLLGTVCYELKVSLLDSSETFVKAQSDILLKGSQELGANAILCHDFVTRRYPKFAAFDMDSTLIEQEVIDELALHAGKGEEVKSVTSNAMNGVLSFEDSLLARISFLKGLHFNSAKKEVLKRIKITNGARDLFTCLQKIGVTTAVISGGFIQFAQFLQKELNIDHAFANELEIDTSGHVTGALVGPIVSPKRKADIVCDIAAKLNSDLSQVVAVGDGANDLLMLGKAGYGVAFNAKPKVQEQSKLRLNHPSLCALMYLFGYTADEIVGLLARDE